MLQFIRSFVFNILFFGCTAVLCFALVWTVLLPRRAAMAVYIAYFKFVYMLERFILGLKVKVEGLEHLPEDGKFIIAAKHQSAMETMIFPFILKDPAIILKKELLQIPFWGWYAAKAEMIGVDRSAGSKALKSMLKGAERVFAEGRPIIIFPQGTRTKLTDTTADKPYKGGLSRLYTGMNCPVVPMALNTGVFWGRNAFMKRAGTATMKFLPPIERGLQGKEMMQRLEDALEPESHRLTQDALKAHAAKANFRALQDILGFFIVLFGLWSAYWCWSANAVERAMLDMRQDVQDDNPLAISYDTVSMSGFPFRIQMNIDNVEFLTPAIRVHIPRLKAHAVPLPGYPLTMESLAPISIHALNTSDNAPARDEFVIDKMNVVIANVIPSPIDGLSDMTQNNYHLESMRIQSGDLVIRAQGHIHQDPETLIHNGEILFILEGYQSYIQGLIEDDIVKPVPAMFFMNMLQNQSKEWLRQAKSNGRKDIPDMAEGGLILPLSVKDNVMYAGMFRIGALNTGTPARTGAAPQEDMGGNAPSSPAPSLKSSPAPAQGSPNKGMPAINDAPVMIDEMQAIPPKLEEDMPPAPAVPQNN